MTDLSALVLANPLDDDRVLVGVRLGERARRASVLAGVDAENVHVVRSAADLEDAKVAVLGPVIVIDATAQVVMTSLVEHFVASSDERVGYDQARDQYAGIFRIDATRLDALWAALQVNFASSAKLAAAIPGKLTTLPIDRHPVRNDGEFRAASEWIFQFVNKPLLDAPVTKYFYRPIARPFTRLFVNLPFTPNHITIVSIVIGQIACVIAARPGYWDHVIGIFSMAFISGILDNVDGELSRLRLQSSKLGAALDGVGDDLLRLSLLLALGVHCAPQFPSLPVMWMAIASVAFTILAMAPMYWYCVGTLKTWNIQNYNTVMGPESTNPLVKIGGQIARRDFVDVATFVLALLGIPIAAVVMFSIGSLVGFITVIPAHLKVVRARA
ncbi:MAG: CDP-alcohol phosphatidyltransferase family protein [Kofleriaceae bacterium]